MLDSTDKLHIQQMIDTSVRKAVAYQTRKRGDTPTDDLQLVPKKYLDSTISTLSRLTIQSTSSNTIPTTFPLGGPIFDYYTDVGNTHTNGTVDDLYVTTLPKNIWSNNGDKMVAEYGGIFVSSGTATREVQILLAGTSIFDTGTLTLSLSSAWTCYVTLIKATSSTIRYMVSFTTEGAALAAYTSTGVLTGMTFTQANNLELTGQANGVGAAANDVVAKLGTVSYYPAA